MSAQTLRIDLHHILLRFPAQPAAGQVWRLAAPRRRSAPRARPAPLLHGCPELELLVGHERSWSGVKVTASRRWPTQPAHRELSQTSRPRPLVFFTPRKRGGGQMCIFAPRRCRWFILNKPLWANVPHRNRDHRASAVRCVVYIHSFPTTSRTQELPLGRAMVVEELARLAGDRDVLLAQQLVLRLQR